jgi:hypothetical protein
LISPPSYTVKLKPTADRHARRDATDRDAGRAPLPGGRRSLGEAERARILLEVTRAVVSNLSLRELLLAVSGCLKQYFNHDIASVVL